MILVDTNLLIYAYVKDSPQHEAALEWLDRQLIEIPLRACHKMSVSRAVKSRHHGP